jgi:hypothetical protein
MRFSFWRGDGKQLVQLSDVRDPAFLELRKQAVGQPKRVRSAGDALLAAVPSLRDELRPLEHGDVLLDGGERHVVARRQLGDRRVGVHDPGQDVAAGRIGQRAEQLIQSLRCRLSIYNHLVVYRSTRPALTDTAPARYDGLVPATTIAIGAALIVLGLAGYGLTGGVSVTALIPAGFGLLFVLAGWLARNERWRMHAMHAAVVVALLGFLGSFRGLLGIAKVFDGTAVRPAAIIAQTMMALLTLSYVVVAVRSFIRARQARRA